MKGVRSIDRSDRVRRKRKSQLARIYGSKCLKCGLPDAVTLDHVVPVALGGSFHLHNLQLLCKPCNLAKGATVVDYRPFHPSSRPVPKKGAKRSSHPGETQ